jgi:phosphoribosyl-dephospho-CoA transferase
MRLDLSREDDLEQIERLIKHADAVVCARRHIHQMIASLVDVIRRLLQLDNQQP